MAIPLKSDGGPAFPKVALGGNNLELRSLPGMSLRDYFAGQVIERCLSQAFNDYERAAKEAYAIADIMIEEREK